MKTYPFVGFIVVSLSVAWGSEVDDPSILPRSTEPTAVSTSSNEPNPVTLDGRKTLRRQQLSAQVTYTYRSFMGKMRLSFDPDGMLSIRVVDGEIALALDAGGKFQMTGRLRSADEINIWITDTLDLEPTRSGFSLSLRMDTWAFAMEVLHASAQGILLARAGWRDLPLYTGQRIDSVLYNGQYQFTKVPPDALEPPPIPPTKTKYTASAPAPKRIGVHFGDVEHPLTWVDRFGLRLGRLAMPNLPLAEFGEAEGGVTEIPSIVVPPDVSP